MMQSMTGSKCYPLFAVYVVVCVVLPSVCVCMCMCTCVGEIRQNKEHMSVQPHSESVMCVWSVGKAKLLPHCYAA
jgi:hypothetical protein